MTLRHVTDTWAAVTTYERSRWNAQQKTADALRALGVTLTEVDPNLREHPHLRGFVYVKISGPKKLLELKADNGMRSMYGAGWRKLFSRVVSAEVHGKTRAGSVVSGLHAINNLHWLGGQGKVRVECISQEGEGQIYGARIEYAGGSSRRRNFARKVLSGEVDLQEMVSYSPPLDGAIWHERSPNGSAWEFLHTGPTDYRRVPFHVITHCPEEAGNYLAFDLFEAGPYYAFDLFEGTMSPQCPSLELAKSWCYARYPHLDAEGWNQAAEGYGKEFIR